VGEAEAATGRRTTGAAAAAAVTGKPTIETALPTAAAGTATGATSGKQKAAAGMSMPAPTTKSEEVLGAAGQPEAAAEAATPVKASTATTNLPFRSPAQAK
jgi:hypothetical protein